MTSLPVVGLPSDSYEKSGFLFHSLGDKYVQALVQVSKTGALLIPNSLTSNQVLAMLDHFDGLLITGAPSNVHPPLYGEAATAKHEPYDMARDGLTFVLIREALARHLPLLCICRGFQELNVVLGGTLETEIQEGNGRLDHRGGEGTPDERYAPAHEIRITKGGMLERLIGKASTKVNTVHRQAIRKLADGLAVEAVAVDGIVEAVSVKGAAAFAFGTQWHPEFKAWENPDSTKIFQAFGDAVRAHQRERSQPRLGGVRVA